MAKYTYLGWYKPGDEIPQRIGIVLGGNLRQNAEPPKPERPASKTLSDEQKRLVAEIKRHHPMATTEGILEHLKEWVEGERWLAEKTKDQG
jgi:hypothetical protein